MGRFNSILSRSNVTVTAERANRWSKAAERKAKRIVEESQEAVEKIEERLENHMDISTSNDLQTANRIDNFDSKKFTQELFDIRKELKLKQLELEIDKETYNWFTEEVSDAPAPPDAK